MTLSAVREVSPLNFELFEAELTHYPDRAKANFVLQSIKEGFRLGCDKPVILKSARRNKLSAYQHSSVIDTYLANKVCGRHDGLMVSALDSEASAQVSSPGRGHCVVFLGKTLYSHDASLHPGVQMGTGEFNAGGNRGEKKYSQSLHATETGISLALMGHLAQMQTLPFYLANEVRLRCVAGPFDAPPVQDLHVRSFGVIPKKRAV